MASTLLLVSIPDGDVRLDDREESSSDLPGLFIRALLIPRNEPAGTVRVGEGL